MTASTSPAELIELGLACGSADCTRRRTHARPDLRQQHLFLFEQPQPVRGIGRMRSRAVGLTQVLVGERLGRSKMACSSAPIWSLD